ncbi:hypothetical protein ACFL1E_00775 [Candidatus Omnitrophota bacterium]
MENRAIRKLTVTGKGKTYYLTLPKDIIRNLKWKKGEKKVVRQEGKRIIIEDWVP